MEPLNDESKLQVDENKNRKFFKYLKSKNLINVNTIRYKLIALSNIIHSILI